jgi:hypothetical protein
MNIESIQYHHPHPGGGTGRNSASGHHDTRPNGGGDRIETTRLLRMTESPPSSSTTSPQKDAAVGTVSSTTLRKHHHRRSKSTTTSDSPVAKESSKTPQRQPSKQETPTSTTDTTQRRNQQQQQQQQQQHKKDDRHTDGPSGEQDEARPKHSPQAPSKSRKEQESTVPIAVIEQPATGTDPKMLQRPIRPPTGLETDFFLQPTILSRLILNQKYGRAIQRVFEHSEETSTWLCAQHQQQQQQPVSPNARKHGESLPSWTSPTSNTANNVTTAGTTTTHSIRQLPIHLACSNLCRTQDASAIALLNELISVLVFAYPDGAHTPDHRNIYPIQEAIWYGVAPETVAIFFMAKPESVLILDHQGRSLSDINQYRTGKGKEAIQLMIDRGVQFWKVARDEAALRLQHNNNSYPSENRSIDSESVLASPNAEEETILTMEASVVQPPPSFYETHATPLAWDQLEQRAKATEQILTAVNEENFRLRQQLESLTNKSSHTHTELMKELKRLDRENSVLNEKIYQLEQLIKDRCVTDDEEKNEQFRLAMAEVSSLIGISEQASLFSGFRASDSQIRLPGGDIVSTTSQRLYEEAMLVQQQLALKHNEQREKIRKLRHMVSYTIINDATSLVNDHDTIDRDGSSSVADGSTISALSLETARSDASHVIHQKRFHYNEGVVDRLPSEAHVLDDLAKIVWYASSRQEVAAKKRGVRVRVQDDLSGILRWAAKKDRREEFYSNSETVSVESTFSPIHPKEIWRSLPRKNTPVGIKPSSKNRVPAPTTRPPSSKPLQPPPPPSPTRAQHRTNTSPRPVPAVTANPRKSTPTSSKKKAPPQQMESFDSVHA